MKKQTTTVRSSPLVRAKARGGSGLPGAAQRARSRQIWPTLEAQLRIARMAWGRVNIKTKRGSYLYWMNEVGKLEKRIAAKARRRPFAARGGLQCRHPEQELRDGPRVPMRWGSGPTQICTCGAWRNTLHRPGPWRYEPISNAMEDDE